MSNSARLPDGRYDFDDMDQMCRCGYSLGCHSLTPPHRIRPDLVEEKDPEAQVPDCDRFRPAKKRKK